MKLLVVSDVHGRYDRLVRVMRMHRDADAMFFLGDGLRDLERADAFSYPFTVYAVKGNCDWVSPILGEDITDELCITLDGVRIFALHGHTRSVKSGLDEAMLAADAREAKLLLYGHTHAEVWKYYPEGSELSDGEQLSRPLYVFNPGSLGDGGSFGIVETCGDGIIAFCGKIV